MSNRQRVRRWLVLAVGCALLIGRAIHLADRKAADGGNFVVDVQTIPDRAPAADDAPVSAEQAHPDPATVPSIPSARPALPKPPVPRSSSARGRREAG